MNTPIQELGDWWAKRDDLAQDSEGYTNPTGSKVRQFLQMAKDSPGKPMVVGCAATSAMQVYVAWAARRCGVDAHVVVAARAARSNSTQYAIDMGATVTEVRPGYTSVLRSRAKAVAKALGGCVRWNFQLAVEDAAAQVADIPAGVQRVVVPTGSGLTATGILVGMYRAGLHIPVHLVCVSGLADAVKVHTTAAEWVFGKDPATLKGFGLGQPRKAQPHPTPIPVTSEVHATKYGKGVDAKLPDGSLLDPYYAAKALASVQPGDLLWVPGCRPVSAF